jgi:hypothetical protein
MDRTADSPSTIFEPDPGEHDGKTKGGADSDLVELSQANKPARLSFEDEMVDDQAEHQD